MKRMILVAVGLAASIALGVYISSSKRPLAAATESVVEPTSARRNGDPQQRDTMAATPQPFPPRAEAEARTTDSLATVATAAVEPRPGFDQAIGTLVSPQATFAEKQAAWKQLKDAGKLDLAISELERRVASDPRSAEDTAALGEAYWQKCGQIKDIREQAILAMKADQTFDAALNLDPYNWEARFTKARAMSYWPKELDKGQEVVEQFTTLIQQQETQPQQPQFARAYIYLGDQYQKAGRTDYAAQVWQRGAAFFPDNAELRDKLSSAP
jgi:tetratricopeptide (TPR) repeat protein